MRSLFHSPFPCTQPPSQQPSPTATAPLQPEMCYRPHPAPMHRQRRSPALLSAACPLPGPALTGPWPTVTRSQGACHAAPPSLPRAAARPHRAPSPEYRPAAPAPIGLASSASRPSRAVARIASTPLRAAIRIPLCRHRADSALIAPHHGHRAPPPSYTCCAHRAHRAPTSASPPHLSPRVAAAPGPWPARTAPYASLFRRMREKGPLPGNIRPKCMLFEIKMATSSPYASHFRAQSGDSGYMARESCRQGPFFASRSPKSRMARRCCQRRPAFPRQRHAAWPNGLCAMRQRPAVRRNWLCAMRRGPGLLAACAPPAVLLVSAAACAPCHLARVHRRRLTRAALRRPRPATRSPHRCISPPARRTHPASRADPPRPGNKRNNANNSMRA